MYRIHPAWRRSAARPKLELLEDRTLPAAVFVVPPEVTQGAGNFHRLTDAVAAAGPGGSVTILPGSIADPATVTISQPNLTIRGDPNVPGSILPTFDVAVQTSSVNFVNLTLGSLTLAAGFGGLSVAHCTVRDITTASSAGGNGGNVITQNTITGNVSLNGNSGPTPTDDLVTFNTFVGFADASPPAFGTMFTAVNDDGVRLEDNVFRGGAGGPMRAVYVAACPTAVIARNSINLIAWSVSPFDTRGIEVLQAGPATSVSVLNNSVATGQGRGIYLHASSDDLLHARVEGNDVASNAVGVYYFGGGGVVLNSDLGGGSEGSLGGNNFRGYTHAGTISAAAVVLRNVGVGAVLKAENNAFYHTVTPVTVVFAETDSTIDVTPALDDNQAFVESLYRNLLGRTGALPEIGGWVSLLTNPAGGQAAVVNSILRSSEALGRIVDRLYVQYLGRHADAAGQSNFVGALQNGTRLQDVEATFLASPEYLGKINTDFVQSLYLNVLKRSAAPSELQSWNNAIPAIGLDGIAARFTNSSEHQLKSTREAFITLLHRTPADQEIAPLASANLDTLSMMALVMGSPEYFTIG